MTGLLVLILLIFGVPYLWRLLRPYFFRWMQRRTENYFRSAMGMPPRDRSRTSSRQSSSYGRSQYRGDSSRRSRRQSSGPVIPKEYAEDVEFTEIRSYSEESVIAGDGGKVRYSSESQVSDAEILEIKKDK